MGRLKSDAQPIMYTSIFSAGVPVILLLLTRSFKEFEEASGSSNTLGFFWTNYVENSFCFVLLISAFRRAKAR